MKKTQSIKLLQIAVPVPLRRYFHYLPPEDEAWRGLQPGMRVRVPFGRRELVGIFVGFASQSDVPAEKLKSVTGLLDSNRLISEDIFQLSLWVSDYYHYPIGEILCSTLPVLLRQGKSLSILNEDYWQLTSLGQSIDPAVLKRAARQIELLNSLKQHPAGVSAKQLRLWGISKAIIKSFHAKNWVEMRSAPSMPLERTDEIQSQPLQLNPAQLQAVSAIQAASRSFQVFLLDGVTGSGKTEVYLQAIAHVLQQQKQVLVLIPEISLTPQTIQRFRDRFSVPMVALHSNLSEKERLNVWSVANSGVAKIVIGTRSAVFSPLPDLGLIIVDEEHDLSFKQQEGFRYHARDLAIMRAHFKKIPVVLGSATPALETLHKAQQGKFVHLRLPERAGLAQIPHYSVVDIRNQYMEEGLSPAVLQEIHAHLQRNEQVMLFLNRRGFAPVLLCHACGWIAVCKRCDTRMTYHQHARQLRCHHCDAQHKLVSKCVACGQSELQPVGLGTQKVEQVLNKHFPDYTTTRIDRDSTKRKGVMEALLQSAQLGESPILLGTQMLAKGHHFPQVTLVVVIDADGGFFSSDFRALERMGQLLLQVAGRAGRAEKKGKVIVQTHHPDHPLLHQLFHQNYHQFATAILQERAAIQLPPYAFFALFRAEAHQKEHATAFLQEVRKLFPAYGKELQILGPISAPMPKRAGRHRMQLLLQAVQRPVLQAHLKKILPEVEKIQAKQKVRWSLDVDPMEMF